MHCTGRESETANNSRKGINPVGVEFGRRVLRCGNVSKAKDHGASPNAQEQQQGGKTEASKKVQFFFVGFPSVVLSFFFAFCHK